MILQPPPAEGLLAVQQVGPGQFQFLFQEIAPARQGVFKNPFAEHLRPQVLARQAFLNFHGPVLIAARFALVQGMAPVELQLPVAFLRVEDFLRLGPLALLQQKIAGSALLFLLQLAETQELLARPRRRFPTRVLPGLLIDHRGSERAAIERMESPRRRGQSGNKDDKEKRGNAKYGV